MTNNQAKPVLDQVSDCLRCCIFRCPMKCLFFIKCIYNIVGKLNYFSIKLFQEGLLEHRKVLGYLLMTMDSNITKINGV